MTLLRMLSSHSVDWRNFQRRLQESPEQARGVDEHGCSLLQRVLARGGQFRNPTALLNIVQTLLEIYPEAAWMGTERFASPLHTACQCCPSLDMLTLLMEARPSVPQDSRALTSLWQCHVSRLGGDENDLVALLLEGSSLEAARIYRQLVAVLEYTVTRRLVRQSPYEKEEEDCLHFVVSATTNVELLGLALAVGSAHRVDSRHGQLPLHSFLSNPLDRRCPADTSTSSVHPLRSVKFLPLFDLLYEAHPQALGVVDGSGRLPMHWAIEAGWNEIVTDRLVPYAPETLETPDPQTGLLPFQSAAVSKAASLNTVYRLLREDPRALLVPLAETQMSDQPTPQTTLSSKRTCFNEDQVRQGGKVTEGLAQLIRHVGAQRNARLYQSLMGLLTTHTAAWDVVHSLAGMPQCPAALLSSLAHYQPAERRYHTDATGQRPLHHLAAVARMEEGLCRQEGYDDDDRRPYLERLDWLLQVDPLACRARDRAGRLPLHVAVASPDAAGTSSPAFPSVMEFLQPLVAKWPDALCFRDDESLLPPALLLASSTAAGAPVDEIYVLLRKAPHVLATTRDAQTQTK